MNDCLIHVVDDDPGLRRSLEMMLQAGGIPVHTYESAERFLEEMNLTLPGCVVLDLRMRGMGGMELLRHLRGAGNEIPVIIISGHADVPTAVLGMKLEAIDLLQKPFEPGNLMEILHRAVETDRRLREQRTQAKGIRDRLAALTARELELLKLIVAGRSNKQIARDLDISIKTVANHRASLMAKTGALNAADLARISTAAGVVQAA